MLGFQHKYRKNAPKYNCQSLLVFEGRKNKIRFFSPFHKPIKGDDKKCLVFHFAKK